MKEPREWILDGDDGTSHALHVGKERFEDVAEPYDIHVIEKSAYDALKAKNERLKEELKLTQNVSDQALKNKVSVLQNQIDQLYKTLIRNAEIQDVPRLVMISVRQEMDALKAKCDAYEQALETISQVPAETDRYGTARKVLEKYRGSK